jgi:hypothetical protein
MLLLFTLALAFTAAPAHAETIGEVAGLALDTYRFTDAETFLADASEPLDPGLGPRMGQIYEFDTKSPHRAFLYSLLVPGLGQLYAGSKVKAALFFVADVAAWGGYLKFRGNGRDAEDAYKAFADRHWYEQPYWDSLLSVRSVEKWKDGDEFPHHIPYEVTANGDTVAVKGLEYYENIGKYQQFIWGWDDLTQISSSAAEPEDNYSSAYRNTYVIMREDANKQFDRATTMAIVSIANHLISAFDAAMTARRHNRSTEQAQRLDVDLKLVTLDRTAMPWVNVAYRF